MAGAPARSLPWIFLGLTAIGVAAVYALDVFVLNQGAVAFVAAASGTLVALVRTALAARAKRWARAAGLLGAALAWLSLAPAVIGTNRWLNRRAEEQVLRVASALARYHRDRGAWPPNLDALVPTYLPSVPAAKPAGMGQLFYDDGARTRGPSLMFVELPPFGRRTYYVVERRWVSID